MTCREVYTSYRHSGGTCCLHLYVSSYKPIYMSSYAGRIEFSTRYYLLKRKYVMFVIFFFLMFWFYYAELFLVIILKTHTNWMTVLKCCIDSIYSWSSMSVSRIFRAISQRYSTCHKLCRIPLSVLYRPLWSSNQAWIYCVLGGIWSYFCQNCRCTAPTYFV
jgi:hypothetical protein